MLASLHRCFCPIRWRIGAELATFDVRMAESAKALGLTVAAA
jgi:hypothetical protein